MSEKRLRGWEPSETHEHFDAEGNPTGTTIVTREPEWDDEQRARMLALAEYERDIHACGFHRSLTFDLSNGFTFELETCTVCAGADQFARRMAERDARERDAAGDHPHSLSSDGRSVFIRQMSADEYAEAQRNKTERAATGRIKRINQDLRDGVNRGDPA